MEYEKIKDKLGDWAPVLRSFLESKEFDNIFAQLKNATQVQQKTVCPSSADIFRSYRLCSRHRVKAIIITPSPYATLRMGTMIADGIPFSCKNIHPYEQPILYSWWQALEHEYGFDPDNDLRTDLSYLLKEERVLLVHSSETVELNKPEIHAILWEPFWKFMIEEVINTLYRGLPIVLIGNQSAKLEKYITPMLHHVLKVEDPVVAVQYNRSWKSDGMFSWVNRILAANNTTGYQNEVRWVKKRGETTVDRQVQKRDNKELPSAQDMGLPWQD